MAKGERTGGKKQALNSRSGKTDTLYAQGIFKPVFARGHVTPWGGDPQGLRSASDGGRAGARGS